MTPLQLNPLLFISFYPELEKYEEQLRLGVSCTEDEEPGDGDDDEPINPLVNALFDEIEALRMQVRLNSD